MFSLIASFIILAMGLAFLRLEQSKAMWRVKLAHAFEKKTETSNRKEGKSGKYALFLLPFITVLREGLEAVVFAGGVSSLLFLRPDQGADAEYCRCPLVPRGPPFRSL